jgi:NTE family protein
MPNSPRLALILAGGGARGAYEAGVLRFVLKDLPKRLGVPIAADLVCGTSVGGINGSYIAARNGDPEGADDLSTFWQELSISEVYRFEALDLLRSPMRLFRGRTADAMGAVDPSPLHALIRNEFPFASLYQTLASGRLQALVLAATDVVSGQAVQFVDGEIGPNALPPPSDVHRFSTRITSEHILASCAIPFLFPPIEIGPRAFVDGSLRQNTPLGPALRLGATSALVVGTKRAKRKRAASMDESDAQASSAFLIGKTLNALLLDPVHQDIERINLINDILSWGTQHYGEGFAGHLNEALRPKLGRSLREVDILPIHPSEDLGRIAAESWDADKIEASRATRMLLHAISDGGDTGEADLLSYLLFDRSYTGIIEQLGHDDAVAQETEIIRFLERTIKEPCS